MRRSCSANVAAATSSTRSERKKWSVSPLGADRSAIQSDPLRVAPMILKLTLEYDGTGFRGWARQPGERTVEGAVRDALGLVFPRAEGLAVAGRTDAGVHATGQVA